MRGKRENHGNGFGEQFTLMANICMHSQLDSESGRQTFQPANCAIKIVE